MNNSTYDKEKRPASNWKIKIYNESLSWGKIYILGKKSQPYHTNWKKSTDMQSIGQKKKRQLLLRFMYKKCSILIRAK